ncbi:NUDIX domain-containing protein [Deferribacteraceae bacterium V6Fe1]|nr:NUDIX domain-containing protein [Deferribacteraceae bacterium V6Fe1]
MSKLSLDIFKLVVQNSPLVSIDFLVVNNNRYLLGKRKNPPANGFYFTVGGRIFKNEKIEDAQRRILKEELNINDEITSRSKFLGVFEHFYDDSIFGNNISTHYVNLAYLVGIKIPDNLPDVQHSEYVWFTKDEIMKNEKIHNYVKLYFERV